MSFPRLAALSLAAFSADGAASKLAAFSADCAASKLLPADSAGPSQQPPLQTVPPRWRPERGAVAGNLAAALQRVVEALDPSRPALGQQLAQLKATVEANQVAITDLPALQRVKRERANLVGGHLDRLSACDH